MLSVNSYGTAGVSLDRWSGGVPTLYQGGEILLESECADTPPFAAAVYFYNVSWRIPVAMKIIKTR